MCAASAPRNMLPFRVHPADQRSRSSMHADALLWDVRNCSDMRKDAAGIAQLLAGAGTDIVGGEENAAKFAGWTIDNTRTNMAALRQLEETHPEWVNQGCIAHGVALSMKDFCTETKTAGRYSQRWGCPWISAATNSANTIANYIQDAGNAKAVLHTHQHELWGRAKKIDVNVPTRFATNLFVMSSVLASKAPLILAASDRTWETLGGKSAQVCICTAAIAQRRP